MHLEIRRGKDWLVSREGVRAPHLFKLRNGELLLTFHIDPDMHFPRRICLRSADGGRTWRKDPPRVCKEMAWGENYSGVVLAFERDTFEKKPGVFLGAHYRSEDGGKIFHGPFESGVRIDRSAGQDYPLSPEHYPEKGSVLREFYGPIPRFYRPIITRASHRRGFNFWRYILWDKKRWLCAMQGKFHGDVAQRSILVESRDEGRNWKFVSTISYEHDSSIDGNCEPALCRVTDGSLLCVMRRHGPAKKSMIQCRSLDNGQTWSPPETIPAHGVDPDLCLMSNGVLACAFGRPGNYLMFSPDGCGYAWGYRTEIANCHSSAMMGMAETAPGKLLLVYDRRIDKYFGGGRNPKNCHIRAVTIQVDRL